MKHLGIWFMCALLMVACQSGGRRSTLLPHPDSVRAHALVALQEEVREYPNDAESWYLISHYQAQLGDSTAAYQALQTALAEEVDSANARLAAFLFGWAGEVEKALAWGEYYWKQASSDWDLRVAMSQWSAETGKPRDGLLYVNQALEKLPRYGPYQYAKANLLLQHMGDTLQGEQWLRRAMTQESGWGPATAGLLAVLLATNRLEEAQSALGTLRNQYPENITLWRRQAEAYEQAQQPDSALWAWHHVLRLDSGRSITFILAEHHRERRQWDSAYYYASALLRVDSTDLEGWRVLARVADTRYRYSDATYYYEQLLGRDSTDQLAQQELANVKRKVAYLRRLRAQRDTTQSDPVGQ